MLDVLMWPLVIQKHSIYHKISVKWIILHSLSCISLKAIILVPANITAPQTYQMALLFYLDFHKAFCKAWAPYLPMYPVYPLFIPELEQKLLLLAGSQASAWVSCQRDSVSCCFTSVFVFVFWKALSGILKYHQLRVLNLLQGARCRCRV